MVTRRLLLLISAVFLATTILYGQAYFNTSLHKTRAGKNYWYGKVNGGFENWTNLPIDTLGCPACHGPTNADGAAYTDPYSAGCNDCHKTGIFNKDSINIAQCNGCHSRQNTERTLGYADVHRDRGFKCWDCHTTEDVHGAATEKQSMLQPGGISVDCSDCHKAGGTAPMPDHSGVDPHAGKLHCVACHAKTVISCYNCHLESQLEHLKRAKQQVHNFVILANRAKDNKVYTMSFQSLTYQGNAFTAFGPYTPHTIDSVGRGCPDCHVNFGGNVAAIQEYNTSGQIYFAKWNSSDSTLTTKTGVVPMPADYKRSFKMDFLTYNGDPADPVAPSKNWSPIGKDTWDGSQMFFATPLTKEQMAKLGFDTLKVTSGMGDNSLTTPRSYSLSQSYPNPFNPETTIEFSLAKTTLVNLTVFNVLGSEVANIIADQRMAEGQHTVKFTASDLPSGVYVYQLSTPEFSQARKMVLVR
jgi:hypothetical protein